jgi:hypothetical protein
MCLQRWTMQFLFCRACIRTNVLTSRGGVTRYTALAVKALANLEVEKLSGCC